MKIVFWLISSKKKCSGLDLLRRQCICFHSCAPLETICMAASEVHQQNHLLQVHKGQLLEKEKLLEGSSSVVLLGMIFILHLLILALTLKDSLKDC